MQRGWGPAVLSVVRRPVLWPTAARQARVLARPGWWRRPPFLPIPDRAYLRFRMQTAYGGDGGTSPTDDDLLAYLRWCRHYPRAAGGLSQR